MQTYILIFLAFLLGLGMGLLICFILKNKVDIENKFLKENLKTPDMLIEVLRKEFSQIANETIIEKQQKLQEQNASTLEDKLKPVIERVKEFQEKVENFNKTEIENNAFLVKQFENLEKNNQMISDEAQKLTLALSKNQNIKGAWGENLISTVLDSSGLMENIHYYKHFHTQNPDGETIYPDIVINLPNDKHLIIDSKFTLTSYIEMCQDDENKESQTKFKREIKSRIDEIAKKEYKEARNLNQPDFVIIYLPLENSVASVYQDSELVQYALNRDIIITGTSSLLTTVRLVNQIWAKEKNNESVRQIVNAGVNMYETFVAFCEDIKALQKQFDNVNSQFKTLLGRFTRNNPKAPSIFSQVEKLKTFGITSAKQIPSEFLETDEDNLIVEVQS